MNRARGFSLIEVLIAILILALGLLGLGALFPVVIREQRIGTDMTIGVIASDTARAELEGLDLRGTTPGVSFWEEWRDFGLYLVPPPGPGNPDQSGIPARTNQTPGVVPGGAMIPRIDALSGSLFLGHGNVTTTPLPATLHEVTLYDRLYPKDVPGADPQFVWDIALQRVVDSDARQPQNSQEIPRFVGPPWVLKDRSPDAIRVIFFLRRLDPRIRLPAGSVPGSNPPRPYRLLDALTNRTSVPTTAYRVPVGVDTTGMPTQDGLGGTNGTPNYSPPVLVDVRFRYSTADQVFNKRDRLYARSTNDQNSQAWKQLRQVNQKLVDNLGNQYTVVELGDENNGADEYVRISPDVPPSITDTMADPGAQEVDQMIRQVVFTPQVPAAVVIWTIKP